MEKKKLLVSVIVVLFLIVLVGAATAILLWPSAPAIPAECSETYAENPTCFDCHESGVNNSPAFPSWHQDKIENGEITEDVDSCLRCHEEE